jgi:hypothetical protein
VSLAALPFEERVMERGSEYELTEGALRRTSSAEDLVVLKAFADQPQDWIDVEGIIARQGGSLKRAQILDELIPLMELKEDYAPEQRVRRLFGKHPAA